MRRPANQDAGQSDGNFGDVRKVSEYFDAIELPELLRTFLKTVLDETKAAQIAEAMQWQATSATLERARRQAL